MTPKRLLDEGRLTEAIERLEEEVAARPEDPASRTFLFELLGFAGEMDRAERQLETIERLDPRPEALTGVETYRILLRSERERLRLFDAGGAPRFFSEPPPAVHLQLEALQLCREGRTGEARSTLDRAASSRRGRRGSVGGASVDAIRDSDDLLAPILEVITIEGYHWIPWEDVQFLLVPPPRDLRDVLWTPARLATHDGRLGEVYLPNLYPASHRHPDEAVRLGRVTDWSDAGSGIARAAGQRLLLVGDDYRTPWALGEVQFVPEEDGDDNPDHAAEDRS